MGLMDTGTGTGTGTQQAQARIKHADTQQTRVQLECCVLQNAWPRRRALGEEVKEVPFVSAHQVAVCTGTGRGRASSERLG